MSGLPEQTTSNIEERKKRDTEFMRQVADVLRVSSLPCDQLTRLGKSLSDKSRLLRFKCRDYYTRVELLKQSKLLKSYPEFESVCLFRDRTQIQRKVDKELREALAKKKSNGSDYTIRNGRIVERTMHRSNFFAKGFTVPASFTVVYANQYSFSFPKT